MNSFDPKETFLQEAEDLLAIIEQSVLDLDNDPTDLEALNRLFRAFHTLKGSGAMFGFDAVAEFTHHIENTLEIVREGSADLTPELIALVLEAKDEIIVLLHTGTSQRSHAILEKLSSIMGADSKKESNEATETPPSASKTSGEERQFQIHLSTATDIFTSGLDPASLLDELRELGECSIIANTDQIPPLDSIDPDKCYFAWQITLTTKHDENAIRDVFIFVEDDCDLRIERMDAASDSSGNLSADRPSESASSAVLGRKPIASQSTLRVTSEKLDRLVNLVGELVMNQSRLSQVANGIESSDLAVPVEEIERLVSELRDNVLGIRMMPIGSTFSRFRRLVHDLSAELGKDINLVTQGEETELDKSVLDQLGDPLVHLIRNSIDHGISSPQERIAMGKPACGTIRLAASHEGAHVVITIEDDGKGLDLEKLRSKAEEKGLIQPSDQLEESEIYNLIFQPGFSTAKDVTNVSGRGVGMDVVRRQIETLGGEIKLSSQSGKGTRIDLTLPLTLAIIDGLLVEVAGDQYIIPMSAVTENVEITPPERAANNGRNLVDVRGDLVPYIRLRELFDMPDEGPAIEKVVITGFEQQRLGFVVDRVLGSHQTVIQSLGKLYEDIEVVSGATIMGDGRVALILDIAGLVRRDKFVSKFLTQNESNLMKTNS